MRFLRGLNLELPCDPVVPLLGIYPKELKWAPKRPLLSPVHSTMHNGIRAQHLELLGPDSPGPCGFHAHSPLFTSSPASGLSTLRLIVI